MPAPRYRSRTLRRVFVKTPGGDVRLHYEKRKHAKKRCYNCGKVLSGVDTGLKYKIKNLSKTQKVPSRPYGGLLCSKCTREKYTEKIWGK